MVVSEKRILDQFYFFGPSSFHRAHFDGSVEYAGIEVIMRDGIARRLLDDLNGHLASESGSRANLRLIELSDVGEGKKRYLFEIIPYSFVSRGEYPSASEEVLGRLPKLVSNFRMRR